MSVEVCQDVFDSRKRITTGSGFEDRRERALLTSLNLSSSTLAIIRKFVQPLTVLDIRGVGNDMDRDKQTDQAYIHSYRSSTSPTSYLISPVRLFSPSIVRVANFGEPTGMTSPVFTHPTFSREPTSHAPPAAFKLSWLEAMWHVSRLYPCRAKSPSDMGIKLSRLQSSLRYTQHSMAKYSFLQSLQEQWGRSVPLVTQDLTEIKEATKFDNVDPFLVDLASCASVNTFCDKLEKEIPRLDILVENAALAQAEFIPTPDGWEHQLQVNHLVAAQLAILLLPLLLRTASKDIAPRLVFVSSSARHWSPPLKLPTSNQGILDWLNDRSRSEGLLHLWIAAQRSDLPRYSLLVFDMFISRSTERGSRQLIFAALGNQDKPDEMKGAYITSSKVVEPSDYVISDEGAKVQKHLWHETLTVLSKISPNVQYTLSSSNLL
ncbi:hypothetical protein BDM02DRAFT_3267016 [Thelephora ganbajun]|uniref:Uncharacterized protein n=1 Tax=Thelephora ganbajun TaxID=370292 RepID=A0ACB6ZPF2_THEGA|nr:hypothetical protein BDM02DRAFT_3267016 [Thelephora ganbajun]